MRDIQMEIFDILSNEQKKRLADRLEERLLDSIDEFDFTGVIETFISDDLIGDAVLFEQVDYERIGEALTEKIIQAVKRG